METTCKLVITRRSAMIALTSATVTMAWACAGPKDHAAGSADSASATAAQTPAQTAAAVKADANDPCRYVTADETRPYVGALVAPPYRVSPDNSLPNPTGEGCLYRGRDGREITIQYLPHGGQMAGTVARRVPAVMDRLLHNAGGAQPGTDDHGLASAVMGSVGPGPWDNSNWFPQGNLIAYKGDAAIMVDIVGADGGKDGAVDLGTKAVNRLSQPLDYNGARAVALAPKPVHPVPPCDLVPRAQAEGILGHLSADPKPDSDGTACTYQVASADGDVSYKMGIGWTQGYKGLNMMKHNMATVGPLLTGAAKTFKTGRQGIPGTVPTSMPDMPKLDSGQQKMFGAFTKALGMPGMGPAVSRGLKTDTTMAGPWDAAALINGSWLMATKDDVSLTIILGTADYDKAKALIAAACERL